MNLGDRVQTALLRTCNITQSNIDKYYSWLGVLAAAEFAIHSTKNKTKHYSPGQLVYDRDMILQIKNTVDWELIRQKNQM